MLISGNIAARQTTVLRAVIAPPASGGMSCRTACYI
jgi:hypothetical protein